MEAAEACNGAEERRCAAEEMKGTSEVRNYAAEKNKRAAGEMIDTGSQRPPRTWDEILCAVRRANELDAEQDRIVAEGVAAAGGDYEVYRAICFRRNWMDSYSRSWGAFEDTTAVGPKRFTYGPATIDAMAHDAVQVFSLKIKEIKEDLGVHWPLEVYGLVAVRDHVDYKRNLIFSRDRNNCQMLTAEDSSLVLTGPSRAVVASDLVTFEVELKVKSSTTPSEDRLLSFLVLEHDCIIGRGVYGVLKTESCSNKQSTVELVYAQLRGTVEAAVDVKVVDGSWGRFRLQLAAHTKSFSEVDYVLLDSREAVVGSYEGMIELSRSVVSVELDGELKLTAEAREHDNKTVVATHAVMFTPKKDGTTWEVFDLGYCKMAVTVYWSLLASY